MPNFNERSQSTAEVKLLPVLEKRSPYWNCIPFSILRTCSHRHVILHLPAKFRNNRTIGRGVMTAAILDFI